MISGNVKPMRTSVAKMTQNVTKMIASRSTIVAGIASAAASETTPRIPPHERITGHVQGGDGSRSRKLLLIQRGTYVAGKIQMKRSRMTAMLMATP